MGGKGSGGAPGSGRPPLRGEAAKELIQIRVTTADKQKIYQAAREKDVSASQFILEAALEAALYLWRVKR